MWPADNKKTAPWVGAVTLEDTRV